VTEPELVPVGPGRDEDGEVEVPAADAAFDGETRGASVADLEALLFVAERPLGRAELRTVARLSADELDARLGDLEVQLRDRGIRLVSSGERVMLGTSPESGALIARYLGADAVRLSPAALETLAIIAYRQPVTRGVIERIRGVDSGHVVRGLLHRRLIHELGRAETPGRPILYGTSMEFMERFGLTSLDDLPPLEAEIAAQLAQAEQDAVEAGTAADEGSGTDAESRADDGSTAAAETSDVEPDEAGASPDDG
jgi:segregation and condensation protein B